MLPWVWECIYQNFVVTSISPYLFVTIASLDPELSMNAWLSKLESSSWLDYVQSVLSTACFVAQCLDTQGSVNLLRLPTFTSLICVETADFMNFILVSSELYMIKHHTKALFVNSIDWSSIQSSIQHSYFIPLILVSSQASFIHSSSLVDCFQILWSEVKTVLQAICCR